MFVLLARPLRQIPPPPPICWPLVSSNFRARKQSTAQATSSRSHLVRFRQTRSLLSASRLSVGEGLQRTRARNNRAVVRANLVAKRSLSAFLRRTNPICKTKVFPPFCSPMQMRRSEQSLGRNLVASSMQHTCLRPAINQTKQLFGQNDWRVLRWQMGRNKVFSWETSSGAEKEAAS